MTRVLIAEDETIIRLDLREILERAGYSVVAEARDGEEAVELAASEKPDLAILDVKMPKLDGIDAARRILTDRPIPIVILTSKTMSAADKRKLNGQISYLAQKGEFDRPALVELVGRLSRVTSPA